MPPDMSLWLDCGRAPQSSHVTSNAGNSDRRDPLFEPIEPTLYGEPNSQASVRFTSAPRRDPFPPFFGAPCGMASFALPFRLLLQHGVWIAARLCGRPLMVGLFNRDQPSFDRRTSIDHIEGLELSADRRGIVSYTEVEVHFPYDLLLSPTVQSLLGVAIEEPRILTTEWFDSLDDAVEKVAILVTNRLLKAYRLLAGKHYVRPITRGELFYVQRGWLMPGLNSPFSMAIGAPQHAIRPSAHVLSPAFHNTLASWLVGEREVPVWVELLQDAREYLDVGQYRHVVIDSRTALEVYVDQTLLAGFRSRNKTVPEAGRELALSSKLSSSLTTHEDVIGLARMNDKLKRGLRESLGVQLGRRRIWADWLRTKSIREQGAHYGSQVSEADARFSLVTIEALVHAIHTAGSQASQHLRLRTNP